MWILKWAGFAVVIIFVLIFALENMGTDSLVQGISLKFLGMQTPELPVFLWLAVSFFSGLLFFMIVSFIREISFHAEISRLKSEINSYEEEFGQQNNGEGDEVLENRQEYTNE